MMSERVQIYLGDYEIETKNKAQYNANDSTYYNSVDTSVFRIENGLKPYAITSEVGTFADGKTIYYPESDTESGLGIWLSHGIEDITSEEAGIKITFPEIISETKGITITFDDLRGTYPKQIRIAYYNGVNVIAQADFAPNASRYYAEIEASNFNTIKIIVLKQNAKIGTKFSEIDFGNGRIYTSKDFESIEINKSFDESLLAIPISSATMIYRAKSAINVPFAKRQKVQISLAGVEQYSGYIIDIARVSETNWRIQIEDIISILEDVNYIGAYANTGKLMVNYLLADACKTAGINCSISPDLADAEMTGGIPNGTVRQAIQMLCLQIGARVLPKRDGIEIVPIETNNVKQLSDYRIRQGSSHESAEKTSELRLCYYTLKSGAEETRIAYKDCYPKDEGTIITFDFNKIYSKFRIQQTIHSGSGKMKVEYLDPQTGNWITPSFSVESGKSTFGGGSSATFKIVYVANSDGVEFELFGYGFAGVGQYGVMSDATVIGKVETVDDQTQLTKDNYTPVLQRLFETARKNEKGKIKIEERRHRNINGEYQDDEPIEIGDKISYTSEYGEQRIGRIVSLSYNVGEGVIVKKCEVLDDNV